VFQPRWLGGWLEFRTCELVWGSLTMLAVVVVVGRKEREKK